MKICIYLGFWRKPEKSADFYPRRHRLSPRHCGEKFANFSPYRREKKPLFFASRTPIGVFFGPRRLIMRLGALGGADGDSGDSGAVGGGADGDSGDSGDSGAVGGGALKTRRYQAISPPSGKLKRHSDKSKITITTLIASNWRNKNPPFYKVASDCRLTSAPLAPTEAILPLARVVGEG